MPIGSEPKPNILEGIEGLKGKVLLADDEKSVRDLTALLLRRKGCTVEMVEDGQQLLDKLQAAKLGEFGLVVTDNMMPKMTGLVALAKIREDSRFDKLPVVFSSGTLDSDIKETVEAFGGIPLNKPFSPDELYEATREAISKSTS